ncbi:hypothetical protein WJX81_008297 [Elliptochloris bilobata]|uniref:Uncharacterized protein n=1 Tax=Elliptochloris bilobata TaxID=381761 RepID=A0AAW1QV55_9CHLO
MPVRARAQRLHAANPLINLLASGICATVPAGIAVVTAKDRDSELERIQTVEGGAPLAAAVATDALAHSLPGLNLLLVPASELFGAAAGVAYLMSVLLSSPSVDPNNLAPKGTVINAETAADSRAAVRVPFTQIVPTVVKVVDTSNEGSSGAGWTTGEGGLPKLPITSVAIVLGVGGAILETVSHAPVLGLFLPRVLQVAGWLAAAGAVLDKREA